MPRKKTNFYLKEEQIYDIIDMARQQQKELVVIDEQFRTAEKWFFIHAKSEIMDKIRGWFKI